MLTSPRHIVAAVHVLMRWVAAAALAAPLAFQPAVAASPAVALYTAKVVRRFPHDPQAFTQGLIVKDGFFYESTGQRGRSSIRKVRIDTGEVLQQAALPADVFGEGITDWADRLVALTWTEQTGYVFDLQSLRLWRRFTYPGEGWGLTHSDRELVMSDGTAELRFLDPVSLHELRRVRVTADGVPVDKLNELEWVEGEVFANVWQTDRIARIDPATGHVVGWIDLTGLLPPGDRSGDPDSVLNGIAYDAKTKRLFVTGKLWPKVFEVQLVRTASKAAR